MGSNPTPSANTELRTPPVADFTPEMAASVLGKSLFDPMMRTCVRELQGFSHKGAWPGPRLQAGHRLGQRNVGL